MQIPILFDVPADDATGEQVKFLTTAEISQKLVDYGAIKWVGRVSKSIYTRVHGRVCIV